MKNTIYIIDDNDMMRIFLESYFSESYHVVSFQKAEDMIEAFKTGKNPDLLILDFNLEEIDGISLMNKVKLVKDDRRNIPVLFVSGDMKSETKIKCLEAGADDYITKPFNPVELKLRVSKLLKYSTVSETI